MNITGLMYSVDISLQAVHMSQTKTLQYNGDLYAFAPAERKKRYADGLNS